MTIYSYNAATTQPLLTTMVHIPWYTVVEPFHLPVTIKFNVKSCGKDIIYIFWL